MRFLAVLIILGLSSFCLAQEAISRDYLIGKFKPAKDKRFAKYGDFYLRKEALAAYRAMEADASKNGVKLRIVSATRSFSDQKGIWERKWKGLIPVNTDTNEFLPKPGSRNDTLTKEERASRILEFSSMPSASRHHWGTDLDFNDVNPSYWERGRGSREYMWLSQNAGRYGFCQVYLAGRERGYKEEKWHWSYIPVAKALTLKYAEQVTNDIIADSGFLGMESAARLNILEDYVLGINSNCK